MKTLCTAWSLFLFIGYANSMTAAPKEAVDLFVAEMGRTSDDLGTWQIVGHPCCHHEEDPNGYVIVQVGDGNYAYVEQVDRSPGASRRLLAHETEPKLVGQVDPRTLSTAIHRRDLEDKDNCIPGCKLEEENQQSLVMGNSGDGVGAASGGPSPVNVQSKVKNFVLLIRFSDHKTRALPTYQDYDQLMNSPDIDSNINPTGSVRSYYQVQSYNRLDLESTVTEWVDVPFTEKEAAMGCSSLCFSQEDQQVFHDAVLFALDAVADKYNFKEFDMNADGNIDAFTIIHSGFGAEWGSYDSSGKGTNDRIWSHKWGLYTGKVIDGVYIRNYNTNPGLWGLSGRGITRIGVICHELGHFFGLPDLYDGRSPISATIGALSIMSNSWGVRGDQKYIGSFGPFEKLALGWANPIELDSSGVKTIEHFQKNGQVYVLRHGFPSNEYLLIESRSSSESVSLWDKYLPSGIYVWRIDEAVGSDWNQEAGYPGQQPKTGASKYTVYPYKHHYVSIIQADGLFDFEKLPWWRFDSKDAYKKTEQVLSDKSTPSLLSYEQLYKSDDDCMTTGNTLSNFWFSNFRDSTFEYTKSSSVPCFGTAPPTTESPTGSPTTGIPTTSPTKRPTQAPTERPTGFPTASPTSRPTSSPTSSPTTGAPTPYPTTPSPTQRPSRNPTPPPSQRPSKSPTQRPTKLPTPSPTLRPTRQPTTPAPTIFPNPTPGRMREYNYCNRASRRTRAAKCNRAKRCFWNNHNNQRSNHQYPVRCLPNFLKEP